MKAVILCTNFDKGLLPLNERTPDAMLRIAGQTAAGLAVKNIAEAGISEIYVLSGYLSDRVRAYFEALDIEGAKLTFGEIEGGLCARLAEIADGGELIAAEIGGAFDLSLGKFVKFFRQRKSRLAVAAVKPYEGSVGCKLRTEGGEVVSFCSDVFAPADMYDGLFASAALFSGDMLSGISDCECRTLAGIVSSQLAEGERVCAYYDGGFYRSLHSPRAFVETAGELLRRGIVSPTAVKLSEGVYSEKDISLSGITLIPPVYIGRNVTLEKGCVIENCAIEDNAVIGSRAELRGCCIGESAVIGAGVSAEKAVVCACAEVRPSARLGEYSAVGEKALVGSGAQIMPEVRIYGGKRTAAGETISDDVTCGVGRPMALDDECCCGFSSGISSPCECAKFAMAVGSSLPEKTVAVCGCCGGAGAAAMLASFESGLISAGMTVLSIGEASGSEVMFLTNRLGADIGCCVNAEFSERIQLMRRGGLELESGLQSAIERAASLGRFRTLPFSDYGARFDLSDAKALYYIFLSQTLPEVFHGLNADVRCSSGAAAKLADSLVRRRNDTDGERVIFHISNDGRICTAYTDATGYVTGERLILLAVKAAFEKDIPVSLPYTFPMAADKLAERLGGKLYRYFHSPMDGEDRAAREIAERPDNFFVRDGMMLMCDVCAYLSKNRVTLFEAMADIPSFYSAQRFAAVESTASEIYKKLGCRREGGCDGIVISGENTRAMVRPLRRRGGLIIFTESVKAETASELSDEILKRLKQE